MFPALSPGRYLFGMIPLYSVMIICGMLLAILLCSHEEKRLLLPEDTVLDLALILIPCGIAGARIYYVIFSWDIFRHDPLSILYIWQGGLAIYGGVIAGLIAALLYARRRKLSPLLLTDMIVPGLSLAQALGRWGNYFNMEAYGAEITNPAWQFFPAGVLIPEGGEYVWHMATFFYESLWDAAVFLLLWFVIRKRKQRHGVVTLWYGLLYGTGRFFIEGLRADSLMTGNLRISQLLSAAIALGSLVTLIFLGAANKRKKEAA